MISFGVWGLTNPHNFFYIYLYNKAAWHCIVTTPVEQCKTTRGSLRSTNMTPILLLCTWTVLKCIKWSELHLADPIQIFLSTPHPKAFEQKEDSETDWGLVWTFILWFFSLYARENIYSICNRLSSFNLAPHVHISTSITYILYCSKHPAEDDDIQFEEMVHYLREDKRIAC